MHVCVLVFPVFLQDFFSSAISHISCRLFCPGLESFKLSGKKKEKSAIAEEIDEGECASV